MRGRGNRGAAETESGAVCFETFVGDHQYEEARSSGLAGGLTLSKRAVCAPFRTLQSAEEVGFSKASSLLNVLAPRDGGYESVCVDVR